MIRFQHKHISQTLILLGIILLFAACEMKPKRVLSQSNMVKVLTDLHKLDGSLSAKGLLFDTSDVKKKYCASVLKKYAISQADFDSSLVWYSKNPKNFDKIYDNVITQLTNLQLDINKGKYHKIDSLDVNKAKLNIWDKRTKYQLTKDSARTHLSFEIADQGFMLGDVFVLRFIQRISPQDSSKNQLIRFQINYTNGRIRGVLKKTWGDKITRRYTLRVKSIYPSKIKSISGEFLGSSAYKGRLNSLTDSISLLRIYDASKQDSLLKVLQNADPKHYPTYSPPKIKLPHQNIRVLVLKK